MRTPRAHAGLATAAGLLGVVTAAMFAWFVIYNLGDDTTIDGETPEVVTVNIIFGSITVCVLLTAAAFTFARRVPGTWAMCFLGVFCPAMVVLTPVLRGQDVGTHLEWVFGFEKSNGVAVGLAVIFGVVTTVVAASAAVMKSSDAPAPAQPWAGA